MEWTGQVYADAPTVAAEIYVEAPLERVWPLVSDIFLMPGLSAELRQVEWLGGATGPAACSGPPRPESPRAPLSSPSTSRAASAADRPRARWACIRRTRSASASEYNRKPPAERPG